MMMRLILLMDVYVFISLNPSPYPQEEEVSGVSRDKLQQMGDELEKAQVRTAIGSDINVYVCVCVYLCVY